MMKTVIKHIHILLDAEFVEQSVSSTPAFSTCRRGKDIASDAHTPKRHRNQSTWRLNFNILLKTSKSYCRTTTIHSFGGVFERTMKQ
ncbi:MAG TPA: hypothetical protein DCE42_18875 [Myxococcales bacterium]|nr:hypothetical protein [Myxococcales bacterium]